MAIVSLLLDGFNYRYPVLINLIKINYLFADSKVVMSIHIYPPNYREIRDSYTTWWW